MKLKANKRFEKFIKKYGFKVRKIAFRNDILSVQYKNMPLMVIPRDMYAFPMQNHTDRNGIVHPDYFDREHYAVAWHKRLSMSNHFDDFLKTQFEYAKIQKDRAA